MILEDIMLLSNITKNIYNNNEYIPAITIDKNKKKLILRHRQ